MNQTTDARTARNLRLADALAELAACAIALGELDDAAQYIDDARAELHELADRLGVEITDPDAVPELPTL